MKKLILLIFFYFGILHATEDYRLILDKVSYEEVDSEKKVVFTLNNSYTFVGDFEEELIEKFPPGTSIIFECDSSGYFLSKRTYHGPFFYQTDSYPVTVPDKTLETLPRVVSIETGLLPHEYYLALDDGTIWYTCPIYFPKCSEFISLCNIHDPLLISHTAYSNYNIINVDIPTHLNQQGSVVFCKKIGYK